MSTGSFVKRKVGRWAAKPIMAIAAGLLLMSLLAVTIPASVQANDLRLEDFIILVDDQLRLEGPASIYSYYGGVGPEDPPIPRRSDLGSRNMGIFGGRANTWVPAEASAVTDVAIIAPNVTLSRFAKVSHVIYDDVGGSFSDPVTVGRVGPSLLETFANNSLTSTDGLDLPAFPAFPSFTASSSSADDIVVATSASVDVLPGTYRDLVLGLNSVARFKESGVYIFRRIIANRASSYAFIMETDDIEIRVEDFVRFAEYGSFNPTGAKDLTLYVAGQDGTYGTDSRRNRNNYGVTRAEGGRLPAGRYPAAFQYTGDGVFLACFVFVPNGTMNIRGHSNPAWATQWFGDSLQEIGGLQIALKHPGEICYELPGIDCACITNFKLKGDGTLKVTGVNFSTATVERLAIFTEGYAAALGGVTQGDAGADQLVATLNIVAADTFYTLNNVQSLLAPGKYWLGIIYPEDPKTLNVGGYCIFTDKPLDIPVPAP